MRTHSRLFISLIGTGSLLLLLLITNAKAQDSAVQSSSSASSVAGNEPAPSDFSTSSEPSLSTNTKIPHARTYLAAIIAQADAIAAVNKHEAKDIRTDAAKLLKDSEQIPTPAEEEKFLAKLTSFHQDIFAGEESNGLETFRTVAAATLTEIREALPLLVKQTTIPLPLVPTTIDTLRNNITRLETDLESVMTGLGLTLWLTELQTVTDTLTAEVPLPPLDLLKEDFALLLARFETYLATVKEAGIDAAQAETDLAALRGKLQEVRTYNGFEELIVIFEQTLGTLRDAPILQPSPPEEP